MVINEALALDEGEQPQPLLRMNPDLAQIDPLQAFFVCESEHRDEPWIDVNQFSFGTGDEDAYRGR